MSIRESVRISENIEREAAMLIDRFSSSVFIFPEMEGGNIFDFVVKNRQPQNQRRLNNFAPQVAKDLLSGLAVSSALSLYYLLNGDETDLEPLSSTSTQKT